MTLAPGTRLGSYEILRRIGAGGMGEVWQAEDPKFRRSVAIKVLPPGLATDAERLKRFEQEARTVGGLNHPNILTVHDLGTHEGAPYLVMELLEGGTLREKLGGTGLPSKKVIEIGLQIAKGLAAAHEKGIVHRDLKPENLFLTRDSRVKILDFGLAKLKSTPASDPDIGEKLTVPMGLEPANTESGMVMGTCAYMSPEQAQGKPLDGRSDLFSLGIILWEMVTGHRPFERDSTFAILQAIVREEPPDLDASLKVPPLLERVLRSCLAKEPEGRFHSAHDLAFALQAAMDAGGSAVGADAVPTRGPARFRRLALGTGLGLLALGIGAVLVRTPWKQLPARNPSLVALPTKVLGVQDAAFLADVIPDTLSTLLGGMGGLDTKVPPSTAEWNRLKEDQGRVAEIYGVENLLLSTVTMQREQLRLNLQIVEPATRKVRWASQFEGTVGGYNQMLQQAARAAAEVLRPRGVQAAGKAPSGLGFEATMLLEEGRALERHWQKAGDLQSFNRALEIFRKAQGMAPTSAEPWVAIGELFTERFNLTKEESFRASAEKALARALELDPQCWKALTVGTTLEFYRPKGDQERIVDLVFRAAAMAPGEPMAMNCLMAASPTYTIQAEMGLKTIERNPLAKIAHANAVFGLLGAGRFDEALATVERGLRIWPEWKFGLELRFLTLCHLGRWEEAHRDYSPDPGSYAEARFLIVKGDLPAARELALAWVAEMRRNEPMKGGLEWGNSVDRWAPLLVRLEMKDEALWVLQKALDSQANLYLEPFLRNPEFKALRGDPRFTRLGEGAQALAGPFLRRAEDALARGGLPDYLKEPVADLGRMVRQSIPRS